MAKHKKRFETIINGKVIKHSTNTRLCDYGWVLLKNGKLVYEAVYYSKNKECAERTGSRQAREWNETRVPEYMGDYTYKVFPLADLNLGEKNEKDNYNCR